MLIKNFIIQQLTIKQMNSFFKRVLKWKNTLGYSSIEILDKKNQQLSSLDFVNNQIPYSKITLIKCTDKMGLMVAHSLIDSISKITGYNSPFKIKNFLNITQNELKENLNIMFEFKKEK